jgi:hypothetical protein
MNEIQRFRISPLIRITLTLFYIALLLPLPFLAAMTGGASPQLLIAGLGLGFVLLQGALAQQVATDDHGIRVEYPGWVPQFLVKGWSLPWAEVQALKMRTTGQGGLVYYFIDRQQQGYLLPMRVAGFAKMTEIIAARTSLDLQDVRPLSQPWMYFILAGLTLLLLLIDTWAIQLSLSPGLDSATFLGVFSTVGQ